MQRKPKQLYRFLQNTITGIIIVVGSFAFITHSYFSFMNIRDTIVQYLTIKMKYCERLVVEDTEKNGSLFVSDNSRKQIADLISDTLFIYNADLKIVDKIIPSPDSVESDPMLERLLNLSYPYNTFLQQVDSLPKIEKNHVAILTSGKYPFVTNAKSVFAITLYHENKCAGYLVLSPFFGTSIKGLGFSYAPRFYSNVFYLLLLIASTIIISKLLLSRVFRPLEEMKQTIRSFGEGDYSKRISAMDYVELNTMVETINQMAENIEQSIESLKLSDRFQKELIANVSHDIKTPLANVIAYIEYSLDSVSNNDVKIKDRLQIALQEANYLQNLIYDLIDLTKIDSQQLSINYEWIHFPELIAELSKVFSIQAADKKISFRSEITESITEIKTDPLRIMQVLKNLFQNSCNHTKEGGLISLLIKSESEFLFIRFSDSGSGIDANHLPHIFDRFYKINSARTRERGSGSGLGLYISKGIIEAMSGTISVESELGKGTVFTIKLPLVIV